MRWVPRNVVTGVAHDTPIPGYRAPHANLLRLWRAEATESFDLEAFNHGDYYGAVHQKVATETISKVLYPNDEPETGKQLRLEQQYFFVSCSLQDMIRLHLLRGCRLDEFHKHWAVQLNDTHPSIAVAELMRLLVDDYQMGWEQAWAVTVQTCAYTNHTLLAEALERWPLPLFERLLPRHLEIIYEINRRFLDTVRLRHPGDDQLAERLSLVDEGGPDTCAWRTSRPPGATPSTAWPPCIPTAPGNGAEGLPHGGCGEVLQRDQRRHAAPLDRAEQSGAERPHHPPHRRPMGRTPRSGAATARTAGGRCRLPGGLASREGGEQT